MNKKVIIQIVIIVGAFTAAGVVLYNGFNPGESVSVDPSAVVSIKEGEKILPYGQAFDFKSDLFKRNFKFGLSSNPTVSPSEIGIPDSALVISTTAQN